ncbi:TetR/AcrR family transcriptional regulator [Sediminibacillus massiliensis]|uniref:TetR/AcrR family transcriptional regulator n=1 Tax=Sediminibacillus massiliensis TaxID=1926277 RepID=UPI0009884857|nr:TetR/AcrR family transcriptional regulator [Sediminibacillus massiliensis]
MNDKKIKIMESAIKHFSRKGYFSTSMQEIAEDCRISKGSLYKYFDSKEDLLIQLFEYNHGKMFERARNIHLDNSLSPSEVFIRTIVIELEGMLENRDFFNVLYKSLPKKDDGQILSLMKRTRMAMIKWHKNLLLKAYAEQAEPFIWDLTIAFQGMVKEFIQMTVQERKPVQLERVAEFIVHALDAMVEKRLEESPVFTPHLMKEYEEFDFENQTIDKAFTIDSLISELKEKIEQLNVPEEEKQELAEAVDYLAHEKEETQPRPFLMKSLLLFLERQEALQSIVHKIDRSLKVKE